MTATAEVAALGAERVFDGHALHRETGLLVRGGRISACFPLADPPPGVSVERVGGLLCPGFVDLQVNGGGGTLLNDDPSAEGVRTIARAHRALGTTSLLPTLVSPGRDLLERAGRSVAEAIRDQESEDLHVLGLHVEGPHLSPARAGAHDTSAIRPLDPPDEALLRGVEAGSTLVTLAPEQVEPAQIEALSRAGVAVFAGHSEAAAEVVSRARAAGLRGFTHLYNAMPPLAGRAPGIVGAALSDPEAFAGIIADGAHVDWASFRVAFGALGPSRLFLVSDAMPPVGAPVALPFDLGGPPIATRGEGDARHCVLPDGTLAGSCLSMAAAVRNAHRHGDVALEAALQMATSTPAAALERHAEVGVLAVGARADLVLLDDALAVRGVWVGGARVG